MNFKLKQALSPITKTVWILSLVSLFTDTASEMLYPIMPIYLKSIGFSMVLIGLLEGFAEATAGLSKGYFGKQSDLSGKRTPYVQVGYALSALSKPLMAAFVYPLWIFFVRTLDRLGKGIRTGARDALLSEESTAATKGAVFGFHRSMDTFGAVLGPSLALVYLYFYPEDYKALFLLAFIPGILATVSAVLIREKHKTSTVSLKSNHFFSFLGYWKTSSPDYKRLVSGLLFFALFNSSDVFLLLKAKEAGLSDPMVIGIYIFYNLIYALSAFPMGILADKIGLSKMFVIGLALFTIVYFGMGLANNRLFILLLFLLYGMYAAATEGVSKAWISNITEKKNIATAIGTYAGFHSICAMLASSLAGFIWFRFGANATFILTGCASGLITLYFLGLSKQSIPVQK